MESQTYSVFNWQILKAAKIWISQAYFHAEPTTLKLWIKYSYQHPNPLKPCNCSFFFMERIKVFHQKANKVPYSFKILSITPLFVGSRANKIKCHFLVLPKRPTDPEPKRYWRCTELLHTHDTRGATVDEQLHTHTADYWPSIAKSPFAPKWYTEKI